MTKNRLSIDAFDLALIRELEGDPLASNTKLGSRLSASPATIGRRIRGLLDRRIIVITTIPSVMTLGYGTQATILVNVSGRNIAEVAEAIASYANVQYVFITTGRYEVIASAMFRDTRDLFNFIKDHLGKIPGITTTETMIGLQVAKSSHSLITQADKRSESQRAHPSLDGLQMRIMAKLERDPRQSITNMARQLGVARHTLSRRLKTLLNDNIIQVVTVTDPLALGHTTRAGILIKVRTSSIPDVADQLVVDKRIQHVGINTGRYDIIAWATFQDREDLSSFIERDLAGITGIVNLETIIVLRRLKGPFRLLLSDLTAP